MIRTSEGIAVIENDTHVSKWVAMEKRLDHDQNSLPEILPLIHPGDVVVDVGAFIGDHTIAYLKAVGDTGTVWAFEPNPDAFECLLVNCPKAKTTCMALGAETGTLNMMPDANAGATHTNDVQAGPILRTTLDTLKLEKLNFLKIDVEGDECKVLRGGWHTIMRCRPIIVVEVADGHLRRQGDNRDRLLGMLDGLGYTWRQIWGGLDMDAPQYDLICQPRSL